MEITNAKLDHGRLNSDFVQGWCPFALLARLAGLLPLTSNRHSRLFIHKTYCHMIGLPLVLGPGLHRRPSVDNS